MPTQDPSPLARLIRTHQPQVLDAWMTAQMSANTRRADLMNDTDLRRESREMLDAVAAGLGGGSHDLQAPVWQNARDMLARISQTRARQGFSPAETATFVFSLKQPIFDLIRQHVSDPVAAADQFWHATTTLDALGLFTAEVHQKSRDETILRQQQEMMELSTPVVTLWEGILALPLIGTLDSARTQVVMESLLQRIVETGSRIAILDITGVPTVDTLVAQHLLKTVAAARLMGADCIISGIRPQIAQTIVHLGVDLNTVTTKATLASAFAVALQHLGLGVSAAAAAPSASRRNARL